MNAASPSPTDLRAAGIVQRARARTERIRATHVLAVTKAAMQVAEHAARASELLEEAEVLDWRHARGGGIHDPLAAAALAIDAACAAMFDQAHASASVARCDAKLAGLGGQSDVGPTPETLRQLAMSGGDSVARLAQLGRLTDEDVRDAGEIAAIYGWVTSRLRAKTMDLAYKSDVGELDGHRRAIDGADWMSLLHAFVYAPWSRNWAADAPLVLALAYEGLSMKEVARRHRTSWERGCERISTALSGYRALRRGYLRHGVQPMTAPSLPPPHRAAG